jgi:hypothetical protein
VTDLLYYLLAAFIGGLGGIFLSSILPTPEKLIFSTIRQRMPSLKGDEKYLTILYATGDKVLMINVRNPDFDQYAYERTMLREYGEDWVNHQLSEDRKMHELLNSIKHKMEQ